jgi:uncharacterized membrane protein YkoI
MATRAALLPLAVALLWGGAASSHAAEAEQHACLTKEQRRGVVAGGHVVTLAKAAQAARKGRGGEIIRASLCRRGKGFVYLLTLLPRDGKVIRATVDAVTGKLVD